MKICKCGKEVKRLAIKDPPTCIACYQKEHRKVKHCDCGNKIYSGTKCQKCNGYKRPKEKCSNCLEIKSVARRIDNKQYCRTCYNKLFRPKHYCFKCNRLKIINSNGLCKTCYSVHKLETDNNYRIRRRIRDRTNRILREYYNTGKIKNDKCVDYEAIIEHLGPCPGKLEDYHIDHIKALCYFNLDDISQRKEAFSPENHQWLKKEDNLKKGKKTMEEWLKENEL